MITKYTLYLIKNFYFLNYKIKCKMYNISKMHNFKKSYIYLYLIINKVKEILHCKTWFYSLKRIIFLSKFLF